MKNWKKASIAALCVAVLLAGCGTQGGKDDGNGGKDDTPMDVTLEMLREVNDPCVLLAKYDAVTVNIQGTDRDGEVAYTARLQYTDGGDSTILMSSHYSYTANSGPGEDELWSEGCGGLYATRMTSDDNASLNIYPIPGEGTEYLLDILPQCADPTAKNAEETLDERSEQDGAVLLSTTTRFDDQDDYYYTTLYYADPETGELLAMSVTDYIEDGEGGATEMGTTLYNWSYDEPYNQEPYKSGRYLLKDISMEIPAGRVIGLTGKSGSGKTTLLRSILGMLHTSCHIDAGKILLDDIDLSHLSRKSHRELCGKKLGFIPQNPMTAFDSRLKIGYQMRETFVNRLHLNTSEATDLAKEKLVSVNLKDTDRILGAYPSELSGGMLQRVAAAILLGMSPDYVLADEPTAALDEENRDLLLLIMQEQMKDKGILFVSHDVAALKNLCQNVYVLGAGKIIEHGTMDKLLSSPQTDWMKQFSALSHRESRGEWKWEKL